ncbi:hypothetical protein ACFLZY_00695 [Patescibacteria group bacterium]
MEPEHGGVMSAYLTFFRGVPAEAMWIEDLPEDDDAYAKGDDMTLWDPVRKCEYPDPEEKRCQWLGIYDPEIGRWTGDTADLKVTSLCRWGRLEPFLDDEALMDFFPSSDGVVIQLSSVIQLVPKFREQLPVIFKRMREDKRDNRDLEQFMKTFSDSLEQALRESPDGSGFAMVAS